MTTNILDCNQTTIRQQLILLEQYNQILNSIPIQTTTRYQLDSNQQQSNDNWHYW